MDLLAFAGHDVVEQLGLKPGSMTLVDIATTVRIGELVGQARRVPGGTVTNTAVGIASLGGRPAFIGAVARDELGDLYIEDLEAVGVHPVLERFPHDIGSPSGATGRCFVLVTPDAERTMSTALGAGGQLDRTGIATDVIEAANLVYFDGYLLDLPDATAIVQKIVTATAASGVAVALGLADETLVGRHFGVLRELVASTVDIVFANEAELLALSGTDDLRAGLAALQRPGLTIVATRGALGAAVSSDAGVIEVPASQVSQVVDATGAGDLFAAGFCFGFTHGMDVEASARLGALAAAEVIGHLGARPETSLAALAAATGLIGPD